MKNRIALVTGGLGDIGSAICQQFHDLGALVIAADIAKGDKVSWHTAYVDVTQFESCKAMADEVVNRFGPVDILVNGAGIMQDSTLRNMTLEQWNKIVHTNLDSLFNVTKQFVEGMIERQYGRIINISSVSGARGQFGQTNYAASKSGIYGFTKSLAQELANYGITVNSISPGFVDSHLVNTIPEKIRNQLMAQIPVGRSAKPHEIAWAIAFLAAEQSAYITGINLPVNGGIHMY